MNVTILRPKSQLKEKILYWVITRELNGVSSTNLSLLYTKLLVCSTVPLIYSKDYMLSIRSISIKYIIVILFLSRIFYYALS